MADELGVPGDRGRRGADLGIGHAQQCRPRGGYLAASKRADDVVSRTPQGKREGAAKSALANDGYVGNAPPGHVNKTRRTKR